MGLFTHKTTDIIIKKASKILEKEGKISIYTEDDVNLETLEYHGEDLKICCGIGSTEIIYFDSRHKELPAILILYKDQEVYNAFLKSFRNYSSEGRALEPWESAVNELYSVIFEGGAPSPIVSKPSNQTDVIEDKNKTYHFCDEL